MKTFSQRVVELALMIPKGKVTTYGRIAKAAGGGGQSARSVTAILGKAFHAGEKQIPFHRIIYTDGRVWVSNTHSAERMKRYKEECILINKGKVVNFAEHLFEFK